MPKILKLLYKHKLLHRQPKTTDMKRIITIFTIAGLLFTFNACEDALTFKIDTEFKVKMDVDVKDTGKSVTYPFTSSGLLNIEDDKDVAEQIEQIKGLEITQVECTITGIPLGQSIPVLNVMVEDINLTVTLTNITENNTLTLSVSDELLDALGVFLYENHQTNITVSGESTYAPMVLGVSLTFHSNIEASL